MSGCVCVCHFDPFHRFISGVGALMSRNLTVFLLAITMCVPVSKNVLNMLHPYLKFVFLSKIQKRSGLSWLCGVVHYLAAEGFQVAVIV